MNCARLPSVIAFLLPVMAARAGDFWLVTNTSTVLEDEKLWVSLVFGETFPLSNGESFISASTFVDRGPENSVNCDCQLELNGAYSTRRGLRGPGVHVLGAEIAPRGPEDHVIQSAKAVVQVEPVEPADLSYAAPLGHSLEIVPVSNPCGWRAGQTADVRVLLDGHPWPGIPVDLFHEGDESRSGAPAIQTDAEGGASIRLSQAGHCSIRAHLDRVRDGLAGTQKESLSATLSFHVVGATDVSRMMLAVRSIHGDLDPAAVLGYRMGRRALQEMNLSGGAANLEATIWAPAASPMMAILDGVQAATSVSYGRENLRLEQTPSPDDTQAVFTDRSTNGRVICAVRRDAELVEALTNGKDAKARRENALWLATRSDADLFDITLMPATPGGSTNHVGAMMTAARAP